MNAGLKYTKVQELCTLLHYFPCSSRRSFLSIYHLLAKTCSLFLRLLYLAFTINLQIDKQVSFVIRKMIAGPPQILISFTVCSYNHMSLEVKASAAANGHVIKMERSFGWRCKGIQGERSTNSKRLRCP